MNFGTLQLSIRHFLVIVIILLLCSLFFLRSFHSSIHPSYGDIPLRNYYDAIVESVSDKTEQLFRTLGILDKFDANLNCTAWVPCVYEAEVDLRIIVITHNRKNSVMKLLESLQTLELDGDTAILEIWVDPKPDGIFHNETLDAVSKFKWVKGPTRVHKQTAHVGIMGQWIDTWRPRNAPAFSKNPEALAALPYRALGYRELALILEDDLNISSQAYRFMKAVHRKYGSRPDYAGVTLQSDEVYAHNNRHGLVAPRNESAFMYICFGTWGFSPSPKMWAEFQDWFHKIRSSPNASSFHPYVEKGTKVTGWYKSFEARGTQDSMWEMWYIYFMDMKNTFAVFSNLAAVNGDKESCMSVNRREVGLHYPSKGPENLCRLLNTWNSSYEDMLPNHPVKFDWNGKIM